MLRHGVDLVMNEQVTPVLLVLIYCAALAFARRTMTPVLIINVATAAVVALYVFTAPGQSIYNSEAWLALFEVAVFATSTAALLRHQIPRWAIWVGFAVNLLLLSALTLFLLTFKMTRLF